MTSRLMAMAREEEGSSFKISKRPAMFVLGSNFWVFPLMVKFILYSHVGAYRCTPSPIERGARRCAPTRFVPILSNYLKPNRLRTLPEFCVEWSRCRRLPFWRQFLCRRLHHEWYRRSQKSQEECRPGGRWLFPVPVG